MMLAIGSEEGLALAMSENSYMDCETKQPRGICRKPQSKEHLWSKGILKSFSGIAAVEHLWNQSSVAYSLPMCFLKGACGKQVTTIMWVILPWWKAHKTL